MDSNPECCRSKRARYQLSYLSLNFATLAVLQFLDIQYKKKIFPISYLLLDGTTDSKHVASGDFNVVFYVAFLYKSPFRFSSI
jgi:hypothetical protein